MSLDRWRVRCPSGQAMEIASSSDPAPSISTVIGLRSLGTRKTWNRFSVVCSTQHSPQPQLSRSQR